MNAISLTPIHSHSTLSARPKVLLVPETGLYLSFRIPPLLQQACWDVDLLCCSGHPLAHSRYINTTFQEKNWEDITERLQEILRNPQRPWQAVIVADEKTVRRLLATEDTELLSYWQPGALKPKVRDFLFDKFAFAEIYQNQTFSVPPSRICRTVAEIVAFGEELHWPLIVKPADESGGNGVIKIDNPTELISIDLDFPILAQKFIRGQGGITEIICSAGKPLAWLNSYLTRRRDGEFSLSTARIFSEMPKLQPLVEQVVRYTEFEGFCGFDWMEDEETGQHYLIDFHPRPTSGLRFGSVCKVNLPAAIKAWLEPETATHIFPQVQSPNHTVRVSYFTSDLFRCIRQHDWLGLKEWLPYSGSYHDIFWDDFPLLTAWLSQRLRQLLKQLIPRG
jgi:hypothetical protein